MFRKRDIQSICLLLALASVLGLSVAWQFGLLFFVVCVVVALRLKRSLLIVVCCLGLLRGWMAWPSTLPSVGAVLSGVVTDDPVYDGGVQYFVQSQFGAVDVRSGFGGELQFGDSVIVSCATLGRMSRFKLPRCDASRVTVARHHGAVVYLSVLHTLKAWLTRGMDRALPSPEAPLLGGILLGSRSALPTTLANAFRLTGTSHIIAVSGYNVTIVISLMAGLIGRLPLPRRAVTVLTVLTIIGFVLMTGASASVVRAGIMGGLAVLARAVGRLSDALHALVISACVMVVFHPATIADVGFQLSVAATAGLILLADPFEKSLHWLPERFGIRGSLSTTMSAIAVTEPIIVLTFGRVALISPIVNVLVLPLVPLSMALGFVVACVAGIAPGLTTAVGWIAWLPLTVIVRVVESAASLPFASLTTMPVVSVGVASALALLSVAFIVRSRGEPHVQS